MQYENERIEYKSRMIDDIYKEVIAFANTEGGVIYLGIDDRGNVVGIDNIPCRNSIGTIRHRTHLIHKKLQERDMVFRHRNGSCRDVTFLGSRL